MKPLLLKIVLVVLLVLSLFVLLLRVYFESYYKPEAIQKDVQPKKETIKEDTLKKNTSASQIKVLLTEENKTLDAEYKTVASEIMDFVHSKKIVRPSEKKFVSTCTTIVQQPIVTTSTISDVKVLPSEKKVHKYDLPKVVIIMDDVRSLLQADMIKKLPVKITPSIFPVTQDHPQTKEVAQMFRCYMVHTPMEAYHFSFPEENTLSIDDSLKTIDERIAEIKRDFPDLVAINNHTGSKFTSDEEAMDKLFCVLEKYNIRFVDSRTSVDTKARLMARSHQQKVLERNIFLDNDDNVQAILERLKETVAYARKHKVAIAICHPKESTFRALKQAKTILHGVEVVTIDELY